MNEESILKQSLVFTGKIVGVVAVWVAVLSFTLVTIAGRAVGSLSGRSNDSADKASTVDVGSAQNKNAPASKGAKPNG